MPFLVQNNRADELFSLTEMERAAEMLDEIYRKAGAENRLQIGFYDGPHKFDDATQIDAFEWLAAMLDQGRTPADAGGGKALVDPS